MATMSSRTRIALSATTQKRMFGPQKVLYLTSFLTMGLCRWSVFPTDPTHHEQNLSFGWIYFGLYTNSDQPFHTESIA